MPDNTQSAFVSDSGDLRRYRTEIPNCIDDMNLSLHAYRLYGHLKRVAGDSGVCWQGTRSLADHCGMGASSVSRAKSELRARGLIQIEEGDRYKGESDTITIADLWLYNMQSYAPSSQEHPLPHRNTPVPTEEHKKEPREERTEEDVSNETSKKPAASTQKVKSIAEDEAEQKWEELCDSDPCGDELRQLAGMAAGENKRGEKTITAVWNQIGSRYVKSREREQLSDEAWHYGFDQAISRGKPSIGYVIACAKGYSPPLANAGAPRSEEPPEPRKPASKPRPVTDEEAGIV